MPMCEFCSVGYGYNTSFSAMEGTSVAHLLGQPVVPAEAFTAAGDGWRQHPGSMKNQTDWAHASGINRLVYHDAYHRYVSRCQFMLQQGRTVADILYLTPEGAPHVFRAPDSALEGEMLDAGTGYNFRNETPLPDRKGYNFDGCPPSMLYRATVKDGLVMFPGGASYRLLALPCFETMTPALLKKIRDLVNEGATVVGLPPKKSPSLNNYPACDREVQQCDIYFVSNRTNQSVTAECKFRITGRCPELWNPMTGEMRLLPEYTDNGDFAVVPLQFDVHQGYFIVFRTKTSVQKVSAKKNFPERKQIATLTAPWTVSFDPVYGGPEKITFEQLTDWSQHTDPGIKYYSGTAVYQQTFDKPVTKSRQLYLDLGKVKNMARVRLNGRDLGVLWTAPWTVDISDAVKSKDNLLEIEVVNLWANRLIGDEQLPDDGIRGGQWPDCLKNGTPRTSGRYTFTTFRHFTKDSPLLESGLLGPVSIWEETSAHHRRLR